jgi:hypothetical protein
MFVNLFLKQYSPSDLCASACCHEEISLRSIIDTKYGECDPLGRAHSCCHEESQRHSNPAFRMRYMYGRDSQKSPEFSHKG